MEKLPLRRIFAGLRLYWNERGSMMVEYDAEMAARVWQRVRGTQNGQMPEAEMPEDGGVQALFMQERTAAEGLTRLARMGRGGKGFSRMAEENRKNAACLAGICRMMGERIPAGIPTPLRERHPEALMRRVLLLELALLQQYMRRAEQGTFGPAFGELVNRKRAQVTALLGLVGASGM